MFKPSIRLAQEAKGEVPLKKGLRGRLLGFLSTFSSDSITSVDGWEKRWEKDTLPGLLEEEREISAMLPWSEKLRRLVSILLGRE